MISEDWKNWNKSYKINQKFPLKLAKILEKKNCYPDTYALEHGDERNSKRGSTPSFTLPSCISAIFFLFWRKRSRRSLNLLLLTSFNSNSKLLRLLVFSKNKHFFPILSNRGLKQNWATIEKFFFLESVLNWILKDFVFDTDWYSFFTFFFPTCGHFSFWLERLN